MQKSIHSKQQNALRDFLVGMRTKKGYTQRVLAERIKRERSFVARVELGERRLDLIEFCSYCQACGTKPERAAAALMRLFEKA